MSLSSGGWQCLIDNSLARTIVSDQFSLSLHHTSHHTPFIIMPTHTIHRGSYNYSSKPGITSPTDLFTKPVHSENNYPSTQSQPVKASAKKLQNDMDLIGGGRPLIGKRRFDRNNSSPSHDWRKKSTPTQGKSSRGDGDFVYGIAPVHIALQTGITMEISVTGQYF